MTIDDPEILEEGARLFGEEALGGGKPCLSDASDRGRRAVGNNDDDAVQRMVQPRGPAEDRNDHRPGRGAVLLALRLTQEAARASLVRVGTAYPPSLGLSSRLTDPVRPPLPLPSLPPISAAPQGVRGRCQARVSFVRRVCARAASDRFRAGDAWVTVSRVQHKSTAGEGDAFEPRVRGHPLPPGH